ncbi:crossover junction endodeoxyribonuclease RuvC [Egicoccus halophilus]|uniref:Crossover junction endodeoxyribonuclease RuvC n=1 Tax=Egicoccus halophilus TaxID=1670830 RepID=A0A8J3ESF7_9ACTN|nr:crossover junction endodeoxyribonuclease RuvC [Egicoccus halophilus]GGI07303.1 crossover junction endodeoxyribonuclease RuvC [Egicoccus halophilus]
MAVEATPGPARATTVLGIDPGLTRCGLGVVCGPDRRPRVVAATCVRTEPDQPLEQRLLVVQDAIEAVIAEHRPDAVAVERVLFSANVRSAMATGQAAGVALVAAARAGLAVTPYSPNEVKQTVAGTGAADKAAVGRLVAAQLGLDEVPRPADVADALAVALTHLARSRLAARVVGTASASVLADAHRAADVAARGGWEAVLGDRLPPSSARRTPTRSARPSPKGR